MGKACRVIQEAGGLAIAAHVDRRPRGFIASLEPLAEKKRIYDCEYLSALEITVARDKSLWAAGAVPNFVKPYACLQNSDSHAPNEVGRRYTLARMPELTLAWLGTAIREHRERLRFPHEMDAAGA